MNITINGMDINDFVQQARRGQLQGTTVSVSGISFSSSNLSNQEVPTKEFGKEVVDKVIVGYENLVFDETDVKIAQTQASIEFKNGAKIEKADAGSKISAENCKFLGKLNAGGTIKLSNCSVTRANAGGKVVAENCEKVGHLNAGGKVELTNCTLGSANAGGKVEANHCQNFATISAGGKVEANHCQNFATISAGGKVEIKNSTVGKVSAGGKVDIRNTTINELEFTQDSTIAGSRVQSIVVNPNCCNNNVLIIGGKMIQSSKSEGTKTNIYLENSIVENIEFVTKGKVFLRGNSEVRGKVINGTIIKS